MNRNVVKLPRRTSIRQQAAEWIARVDRGELTPAERDELTAWAARSPAHQKTLMELSRLWDSMDTLAQLTPLFPNAESAREAAVPRPRISRHLGLAAAAVLLLGLGLLLTRLTGNPVDAALYRTAIGQQQEYILHDGSRLTLNTGSVVEVRLESRQRTLRLLQGEAFFNVAKNRDQPFVVYAGHGSVTAVGTAFAVQVAGDDVDVVVHEGTVKVTAGETRDVAASRPAILLHQHGTTRFRDVVEPPRYLDSTELSRRLAWKDGHWLFDGETLADVVAQINRYTDTKLFIADPELNNIRIGGYFAVGNIDALLDALHATFGIVATREANQIRLVAANPASKPI